MRTSWTCLLLAAGAACATKGRGPPPAPVMPAEAPATVGCGPESFAGAWLIQSGVATLTCDDGTNVSVVAGGNIRVEAPSMPGFPLTLIDGQCRYPLAPNGCTLAGSGGVACLEGETRYTSRSIQIARDGAGVTSISYVLEQPDPDNPRAKCVASTVGKLARAARNGGPCSAEGRWEIATTPDGRPGATALVVAHGRCALEAPDFKTEGPCQRDGDLLILRNERAAAGSKAGGCAAGALGRYIMTFAADCSALELEARDDACPARRDTIEFLYLGRLSDR